MIVRPRSWSLSMMLLRCQRSLSFDTSHTISFQQSQNPDRRPTILQISSRSWMTTIRELGSLKWYRMSHTVWLVSKDKDLWHLSNIVEKRPRSWAYDHRRTIVCNHGRSTSLANDLSPTILVAFPRSYQGAEDLCLLRIWGLRSRSSGSTIIVRNHNKI